MVIPLPKVQQHEFFSGWQQYQRNPRFRIAISVRLVLVWGYLPVHHNNLEFWSFWYIPPLDIGTNCIEQLKYPRQSIYLDLILKGGGGLNFHVRIYYYYYKISFQKNCFWFVQKIIFVFVKLRKKVCFSLVFFVKML